MRMSPLTFLPSREVSVASYRRLFVVLRSMPCSLARFWTAVWRAAGVASAARPATIACRSERLASEGLIARSAYLPIGVSSQPNELKLAVAADWRAVQHGEGGVTGGTA